jgi:hypothetical protein
MTTPINCLCNRDIVHPLKVAVIMTICALFVLSDTLAGKLCINSNTTFHRSMHSLYSCVFAYHSAFVSYNISCSALLALCTVSQQLTPL